MRFLIVDDKPENLFILESWLKTGKNETVSAANGAQALEKLKSGKFDMIISDILMPVMDGFHFCYEVKNDKSLANIPFIFFSAIFTDKRDEERALKMGADAFLVKPITSEKFMKVIKDLAQEVKDGKYKAKRPVEEKEAVPSIKREDMISKLEEKNQELEKEISERKQAEEKIKESEAKYRMLAENAQDIIFRIELKPEQHFSYVNPAATRIIGYTPEEHYANHELGFKTIHPDDRHILEEMAKGDIPMNKPIAMRWQHKNGSWIWLEQQNMPIFNEKKEVIAIEGLARDITERKKAEEKLRESEENYRVIFNSSNDIMVRLDLTGKILDVNEVASKLGGWGRDEILGKNVATLASLFTPGSLALILTNFGKALLGIDTGPYEVEGKTKDGRHVYLETNSIHMKDAKGKLYGILAVLHDITKSKTLEIELKNKLADLETYYKASMGREDKILELKKEIAELEKSKKV